MSTTPPNAHFSPPPAGSGGELSPPHSSQVQSVATEVVTANTTIPPTGSVPALQRFKGSPGFQWGSALDKMKKSKKRKNNNDSNDLANTGGSGTASILQKDIIYYTKLENKNEPVPKGSTHFRQEGLDYHLPVQTGHMCMP